jgi:hypothetical protein
MGSKRESPKRGWTDGDYFVSSYHLQWVSEVLRDYLQIIAVKG